MKKVIAIWSFDDFFKMTLGTTYGDTLYITWNRRQGTRAKFRRSWPDFVFATTQQYFLCYMYIYYIYIYIYIYCRYKNWAMSLLFRYVTGQLTWVSHSLSESVSHNNCDICVTTIVTDCFNSCDNSVVFGKIIWIVEGRDWFCWKAAELCF